MRRIALWTAVLLVAGLTLATCAGCSPTYVIRAGIAEAKILAARRPIPEVILDPATDERTRGLLTISTEARTFALESLGLDAGDSYTSYTELETDTLAMVLSAAYRDRLASKTWWFPIVGHVPYKGYFDFGKAEREQAKLEDEGYDTLLRPTGAFSTLGWFADPLLSTVLRQDDIGVVGTIIHELSHNTLFVSGQVRFNESFATFVGGVGSAEFFCTRDGGGPDTVKCQRAQARWRDQVRYSTFLDPLVDELTQLYASAELSPEEKVARRETIFESARTAFRDEVQPSFEASTFSSFLSRPLNNATLLAQMRYYHRLADFEALYEAQGRSLRSAVAALGSAADADDPFSLLPGG